MKKLILLMVFSIIMISVSGFSKKSKKNKSLRYVAKVIKVKGDVSIKRKGSLKKLKKGRKIKQGDIIVTGTRSYALIKLGDKSTVMIESLTIMKWDLIKGIDAKPGRSRRRYRVRLKLRVGGIRARVRRVRGLRKRFRVRTPKGTASVRGTDKIVRYSRDKGMQVFVIKGLVDVHNNQGRGKRIGKGESTSVKNYDTDSLEDEKSRKNRRTLITHGHQTEEEEDDAATSRVELNDNDTFDAYNTSNTAVGKGCGC